MSKYYALVDDWGTPCIFIKAENKYEASKKLKGFSKSEVKNIVKEGRFLIKG